MRHIAAADRHRASQIIHIIVASRTYHTQDRNFLLHFQFNHAGRSLIGFHTGNHFVFQQFVFNPVGVDLVHRPLDRVQVSLLEDMHQIALAHKMLVKAVHDHYLQVTAQLLLPAFPKEEGDKHDVAEQQCCNDYGYDTDHDLFFFIQYLFYRIYQQFNIAGSDHQDDFELTGFGSHHVQQFLLADQPLVGNGHGIEDNL